MLPVYNVTGSKQCGCVDHRVPCCTSSIEIWILTNQVAGQKTTMRATHHCHPIRIKGRLILQSAQHCPLDTKYDKWAHFSSICTHYLCIYTHEHLWRPDCQHFQEETLCHLDQNQWSPCSSLWHTKSYFKSVLTLYFLLWQELECHINSIPIRTANPSLVKAAAVAFQSAAKWAWGPPAQTNTLLINYVWEIMTAWTKQLTVLPCIFTTRGLFLLSGRLYGFNKIAPKFSPAI